MARLDEPSDEAPVSAVRVVPGLGYESGTTAIFLYGKHDSASREPVERALTALGSHVIIDLSWCTVIDATIIALILAKQAALARDGHALEVIVPRTLEQLTRGLDRHGLRGREAV